MMTSLVYTSLYQGFFVTGCLSAVQEMAIGISLPSRHILHTTQSFNLRTIVLPGILFDEKITQLVN